MELLFVSITEASALAFRERGRCWPAIVVLKVRSLVEGIATREYDGPRGVATGGVALRKSLSAKVLHDCIKFGAPDHPPTFFSQANTKQDNKAGTYLPTCINFLATKLLDSSLLHGTSIQIHGLVDHPPPPKTRRTPTISLTAATGVNRCSILVSSHRKAICL